MQSFRGGIRSKIVHFKSCFETNDGFVAAAANLCGKSFDSSIRKFSSFSSLPSSRFGSQAEILTPSGSQLYRSSRPDLFQWTATMRTFQGKCLSTSVNPISASQDSAAPVSDLPPRIKFKRLDKTAKHIMQILDKEAVEEARTKREIPEIKPGYIIQLKVEVPENKRRISTMKGIVIARRNAGLNTTFRLRRLVAGVGIESLFPLYSPSIKEIKVLDKKKVRRAKLYYLRERMNPLKK